LDAAMEALPSPDIEVIAQSAWYTYPPVGGPPGQGDYLNGALLLGTRLDAESLAKRLRDVELAAGRSRVTRWAARTLDCDLLLYGEQQIQTSSLTVPHPRMIARRFVLEPAAEIAGDLVHPELGWTIRQLLDHINTSKSYFAFVGSDQARVQQLVRDVAAQTNARLIESDFDPLNDSIWPQQLEFAQRFAETIDAGRNLVDDHVVLSCGWYWQPLLHAPPRERDRCLYELGRTAPKLEPRLIVMCDSKASNLGQCLRQLPASLQRPTLWLSDTPAEALQDAVGAVISMR
jgi:2-amino-4-hydroxy-6-hydroxymethyldihydropteridine diphosphokinase